MKIIKSNNFKKRYNSLEGSIKKKVDNIIEKLKKGLKGELLNKDLLGFYAVHFHRNKFRLVYYQEKGEDEIILNHIDKRTPKFYEKFEDNVKRKGKFYDKELRIPDKLVDEETLEFIEKNKDLIREIASL